MNDTPTLHDLFNNQRIKGLSFWCNALSCQYHEIFPVGPIAIDHGPDQTFADMKAECWCRKCGAGRMSIKPNWGEGGQSWFERL